MGPAYDRCVPVREVHVTTRGQNGHAPPDHGGRQVAVVMVMKNESLWFVVAATCALAGCVSSGKYDQAVAQTQTTSAELHRRTESLDQANRDLEQQRGEISQFEKELAQSATTSRNDGTKKEGQIAELRKRLEELRAQHATAERRATMFRDLAKRLEHEINAGELSIVLRDQRMVLQLPNDVLFDTGRTDLKPAGKAALVAIAGALKTIPNRQFQVAGHTDDVPIGRAPFASNWELSSARALRVVHFLIEKDMPPAMLSAAGYGEVDPVISNATSEGKQKNRRTEITLQPNIDELIQVP